MRELDPPHREVVELVHLLGLSHQAAAARLRLPLGTVKSRLFRAHRHLAALLADGRRTEDPRASWPVRPPARR